MKKSIILVLLSCATPALAAQNEGDISTDRRSHIELNRPVFTI